jgi:hypothetical protein
MHSFRYNKSKKFSLLALGVLCILFIVTSPIGVWLVIISFRRVEISKTSISIQPFGKSFKFSEVERFGYCELGMLIGGNTLLNSSASPQRVSAPIVILENKEKKRIRIGLSDYPKELFDTLKAEMKRHPEVMDQRPFLRWKVDFRAKKNVG